MSGEPKKVAWIIVGLMLGMLLGALDQTIISTAMPTVIRDLGGIAMYSWVFSIYMLTSTTSMPIFGKLADLYGRKRIYLVGISVFVIGSALCGLATNMTELIIYRGLQGIGAGALMPIAMTIIGDIMPVEKRGKMQGLFGGVMALSSIIGPAIGGFIVEHLNWSWIFYVNLPFGIAAMVIIGSALKESRTNEKRSIDWLGALTLSGAIVSGLLGLVLGGDPEAAGSLHYAWGSPQIIGLFSACAILLGLFLWVETKAKEPMIPLHLFKNKVISVTSMIAVLMSVGMFGAITYIPLFVQGVIGVSPSIAGYILTPLLLSVVASAIIGGRMSSKVSYRSLIGTGMVLIGIGFTFMSTMDAGTSKLLIILYMIVAGLGMGLIMPTLNIAVQGEVGATSRGIVTSLVQFFRSIGATVGVSIMGVMMTNRMAEGLSGMGEKFSQIPAEQLGKFANPQVLLDANARAKLPVDILTELQKVFVHGLSGIFLAGSLIVFAGVIITFFLGKARMLPQVTMPMDNDARPNKDSVLQQSEFV